MEGVSAGISLNLDADLLSTSLPLLEQGYVEVMEWSFDTLFYRQTIPLWFKDLAQAFSDENKLIGHGVYYSLFSGRFSSHQQQWLEAVTDISKEYNFAHITEHFGFMTGQDFHSGAPLSVPYTPETKDIAINRLRWLSYHAKVPVGLENLAFAFSEFDVMIHGKFLENILIEINGFIILDLHNLYCQVHNFGIPFSALIKHIPLHLVREIHISGGSWSESDLDKGRKIRRDTHDSSVPEKVFQYLEKVIPLCPNLRFVLLEQLGNFLKSESARDRFRHDFKTMSSICRKAPNQKYSNEFLPDQFLQPSEYLESDDLYTEQVYLSNILETATSPHEAYQMIHDSRLANSDWRIEDWEIHMVETAWKISQKWKDGPPQKQINNSIVRKNAH